MLQDITNYPHELTKQIDLFQGVYMLQCFVTWQFYFACYKSQQKQI
jgi:hypothetical protein